MPELVGGGSVITGASVFVNTSQSLASKLKLVTGHFSSPMLNLRIGGKALLWANFSPNSQLDQSEHSFE